MTGILLFAVLSWSAFIMRAGRGRQGGQGIFFTDGQRRAGSWLIGVPAPLVALLFAAEKDDIMSGLALLGGLVAAALVIRPRRGREAGANEADSEPTLPER